MTKGGEDSIIKKPHAEERQKSGFYSGFFRMDRLKIKNETSGSVAQLVEQRTENPRVVGSIPTEGTIRGFSSSGRAPPCQGGGSEFEPRNPLHKKEKGAFVIIRRLFSYNSIWRHSQVVRQRSAKPLFTSSNRVGASKKTMDFSMVFYFCGQMK